MAAVSSRGSRTLAPRVTQDEEGNRLGIDVPICVYPETVVGYQYQVAPGGPKLPSILVDPLPGGDSLFELVFGSFVEPLVAGVTFNFTDLLAGGVDGFLLWGLELAEMFDPNASPAFVTGLPFVGAGTGVGMTMTAITQEAPVPGTALLFSLGLLALPRRRWAACHT